MARYVGQFFGDMGVLCRMMFDSVFESLLEPVLAFLAVIWSFLMAAWEDPQVIKSTLLDDSMRPFYAIYLNIILSILFCFIIRKAGEYIFRKNEYKALVFNEAVLAIQVSLCAYGESAIFEKYGYLAFFICTGIDMTITDLVNGRLSNVLLIAEEFRNGFVTENDVLYGIVSPLAASVPCFWVGAVLFEVTTEFITGIPVSPTDCHLMHRIPIQLSFLVEMFGAFVFRIFMTQLDLPGRRWRLIPWVYSAFFTLDQYILGVPGLHVVIAMSRFVPCSLPENDDRLIVGAFAVYVCAIYLGWHLSSLVPKGPTAMRSVWRLRQEKLEKDGKGETGGAIERAQAKKQQEQYQRYGGFARRRRR